METTRSSNSKQSIGSHNNHGAKPRPAATPGMGSAQKTKPNITLPLNTKTTKKNNSDKALTSETNTNRPCREHSFLTDVADVRQMEQGLLQLLDDFHTGKLQAFGRDSMFDKMDQVREQQERLAKLHFELDSQQEMKGEKGRTWNMFGARYDSAEAREAANKNLGKLMDNLQELCTSIQNLQKGDQPPQQQGAHQ